MQIQINEKFVEVATGATLFQVRDRFHPEADVLICNGFPAGGDIPLQEGDRVVLIRRGEQPAEEEMEALLYSRHTPGVHERLSGATVGIAGAGGLGSAVAVALTRLGIGTLIVADFDVVEPSNLNRQQYFIDQIGLPKVDALQANLARINPYVRVTIFNGRLTRHNIPAVFTEIDVLVEAFDAADQKAMLAETFRGHFPGIPLVAASGLAGYGPAETIRTRRAANNFYLWATAKAPPARARD